MNKLIVIGIFVAIFVVVGPLITIWSLNTLFHTGIENNLETWAATFLLTGLITGSKLNGK